MNAAAQIVIRILSDPNHLCVIRAAIETALCNMGMDDSAIPKVVLAVDEAVTNVIRHAYHRQSGRPITLSLTPTEWKNEPAIEILIEDESTGVDLSKIQGRPLDEVRPGGLGVHIIHGAMDLAQYSHRTNGNGVQLKMIKRLAPHEPVTESSSNG